MYLILIFAYLCVLGAGLLFYRLILGADALRENWSLVVIITALAFSGLYGLLLAVGMIGGS